MEDKMKILKAINEVQSKFQTVYKDGKVGFGNNSYTVVTYDNLVTGIKPHLIEAKIIINPVQVDRGIYTEGKTAKGNTKLRYDALYDVEFISAEDGSKIVSRVEVSSETFGDDKAPSKATTVAVKNAILKLFSIQSADEKTDESSNIITDKQFAILKGLVESTKTDLVKFLAFYNADTLKDFPQVYYSKAVEQLQKKVKKG